MDEKSGPLPEPGWTSTLPSCDFDIESHVPMARTLRGLRDMDSSRRVLVVEDDQDIREMLAELLGTRCTVAMAEDGIHALEMLTDHRHEFDAVVVDLEMPGLGGIALLADLRERGINVPALIMSGVPGAGRRAREARADFIAKPFELDTFEAKVDELLQTAS